MPAPRVAAGPGVSGSGVARRCRDARVTHRRSRPGGLVADPGQYPNEEEAGIQRPVGLCRTLIVRWYWCGPVSMPSTSQASATTNSTMHGATPRRASRPPPRPGRGQGSWTGGRWQPNLFPRVPGHSVRSTATTAPSESTQVISRRCSGAVKDAHPSTPHAQSYAGDGEKEAVPTHCTGITQRRRLGIACVTGERDQTADWARAKVDPGPGAPGLGSADRQGGVARHRDFRLLWGGETVSELGSQVSLLAIPLLAVRTLHATTFEMGLLTAASTAAFLVVGLPAGVWVDRMRRRSVMIVVDLGRMLALRVSPGRLRPRRSPLAHLFVVTLSSGILTVFFDVAYQSYLPALDERHHALRRLARPPGRRPHRRGARLRPRAAADAVDRRHRRGGGGGLARGIAHAQHAGLPRRPRGELPACEVTSGPTSNPLMARSWRQGRTFLRRPSGSRTCETSPQTWHE